MKYVIYDQFHWLCPDHVERHVEGTKKEILEQYAFYVDCYPNESLGLVPEVEFKKLKESLKQQRHGNNIQDGRKGHRNRA